MGRFWGLIGQSEQIWLFLRPDGPNQINFIICRQMPDGIRTFGQIFWNFVWTYKPDFQKFSSGLVTYIQESCHHVSRWLRAQLSRVNFEFTLHCHALQHTDVSDMANIQTRRDFLKNLELGLKMPWYPAQIFSMSLHEYLLQLRHPSIKSKFWHYKLKDHALYLKFWFIKNSYQ